MKYLPIFALVLLVGCASDVHIGTSTQEREVRMTIIDGEEYLPINKVAPCYPKKAATKRLGGYCIVEFDVSVTGNTKDHRIVSCSNGVFAQCSLGAAKNFRYSPAVVNGVKSEVKGVQNKFKFAIY